MSMFYARLLCLIDHHEPDRNRVRWDGVTYAGTCTHCGVAIRRLRARRWTARPRPAPLNVPGQDTDAEASAPAPADPPEMHGMIEA